MLTTDRSRHGSRGPIAIAFVAAALLIAPATAVLAMDSSANELEPRALTMLEEQPTLTQLRDQLDALGAQNSDLADQNVVLVDANGLLEADNGSLARAVEEMTRERDRLQSSIEHFDDLFDPLEADRQLLVELRKGLPETRVEAQAQLDRMRRLALSSNPARLGQLVDRVAENAPAFLDWRFTEFGSGLEANQAYVNSGANAFDSSMDDFRSAVLLSVANRIDGLLNVIDRVR